MVYVMVLWPEYSNHVDQDQCVKASVALSSHCTWSVVHRRNYT